MTEKKKFFCFFSELMFREGSLARGQIGAVEVGPLIEREKERYARGCGCAHMYVRV